MLKNYVPQDLTQIDPRLADNLDYWARTLEMDPEKIRQAVEKAGPELESVKKELGISGV